MKLIPLEYLFTSGALSDSEYYKLNQTHIMLMGNVGVKISKLSKGIVELYNKEKPFMTRSADIEVLPRDIIRVYFEAMNV